VDLAVREPPIFASSEWFIAGAAEGVLPRKAWFKACCCSGPLGRAESARDIPPRLASHPVPGGGGGLAILFTDFMDLDNVGVLQVSERLALATEAVQVLRTGVGTGHDHLEGNQPLEPNLAGLVDDPHTAPA